MNESAAAIIRHLNLQPLQPEGGFFRRSFTHARMLQSANEIDSRPLSTVIYYLVTSSDVSALHRLAGTEEIWFYHLGDPLEMLLLHPDGSAESPVLGPDLLVGQVVQQLIPPGTWQGCRPLPPFHGYTLCSALVTPGFDWNDFEMGDPDSLVNQWPAHESRIRQLLPP